jgi:hypothetical protein
MIFFSPGAWGLLGWPWANHFGLGAKGRGLTQLAPTQYSCFFEKRDHYVLYYEKSI